MRRVRTSPRGIGLVAAVALAGGVAHAADPTRKSGWEGFAPGSFVRLEVTTTFTDPAAKTSPTTIEVKHTLVETTNEGSVVKVETREGERWVTSEPRRLVRHLPPIHPDGVKIETLGTEKVTIEG